MVTIATIAQRVLDENGWETADIHATPATALTRVEYMIDNAIDHINFHAGTTIADLSGGVGAKSLVATANEIVVIKALSVLMVRAHLDRGPNVSLPGVSASTVLADPQYSLYNKIVNQGINRLRGRTFVRT